MRLTSFVASCSPSRFGKSLPGHPEAMEVVPVDEVVGHLLASYGLSLKYVSMAFV